MRSSRHLYLLPVILVGSAVALGVAVWCVSDGLDGMAKFGDFLSGIAGGMGLLGMAVALYLQTRELRLQREELALQREELAQTRVQVSRQADQLEEQVHLQREQVELAYLPRIQHEWDLTEKAAKLTLKNLGKGTAQVSWIQVVDHDGSQPPHTREGFEQLVRGRFGAVGAKIECAVAGELREGMTIKGDGQLLLVNIYVSGRPLPDLSKTMHAMQSVELRLGFASPSKADWEQRLDIELAYLEQNWRPRQ